MLTLLAASAVVGTYAGGTGTGWDFRLVLRADGSGTYGYQGCFDDRDAPLAWRVEGSTVRVGERSVGGRFRDGRGPYISCRNRYALERFRGETFLVPEEAVAAFMNSARRGELRWSGSRWRYLRRETPTPRPPKRPWLFGS